MQPWKVIQELEADNSRLKKEAIIKRESDADNIRFFNGVGAALDGFRTFGVQKVPVAKKDGPGITQSDFDDILKSLESRSLTGNAMKDTIQVLCDSSKVEQWNDWYRRILIKDLAVFYYNPHIANPNWGKIYNETAMIGNHRFMKDR